MFQDLQFGVRLLLKHRGFTAVDVLSLALGVGGNTAIFSLINPALLKTLPVKDPQQLVFFMVTGPQETGTGFSYPLLEQFNRNNHSLAGIIAASTAGRMRLTGPGAGGQLELVQAGRVSGDFFSVLGVGAIVGRTLTEDEPGVGGGDWRRQELGLLLAQWGARLLLAYLPQEAMKGDPLTALRHE